MRTIGYQNSFFVRVRATCVCEFNQPYYWEHGCCVTTNRYGNFVVYIYLPDCAARELPDITQRCKRQNGYCTLIILNVNGEERQICESQLIIIYK